MTAPATRRRRVTQRFPALIPARMAQRRLTKRVQDERAGYRYAVLRSNADLPWLVAEHASILERTCRAWTRHCSATRSRTSAWRRGASHQVADDETC